MIGRSACLIGLIKSIARASTSRMLDMKYGGNRGTGDRTSHTNQNMQANIMHIHDVAEEGGHYGLTRNTKYRRNDSSASAPCLSAKSLLLG